MKEFSGKVAVITGAASGIGLAIARCAAGRGMKLVLADVQRPALESLAQELHAAGVDVLAVPTDVSDAAQVEALAAQALGAFQGVHLLFNNAGVGAGLSVWESTLADWQWVLGVNLWGVIHGCRTFVPIMLRQGTQAHVVNTASAAGLFNGHPCAPYQVTKHAVVALSEHLHFTLAEMHAQVGVSVLCPGWVRTAILESERNRPAALQNPPRTAPRSAEEQHIGEIMMKEIAAGMPPERVADCVFEGIEAGRFYILTHDEYDPLIRSRMEAILNRTSPPAS